VLFAFAFSWLALEYAGIKEVGRQSFILQRARGRPGAIAADKEEKHERQDERRTSD
jgi:hypothetical protein